MPSQVLGMIEASQVASACGWQTLVEASSDWNALPVEQIEADLPQLEADLSAEWTQLCQRLGHDS